MKQPLARFAPLTESIAVRSGVDGPGAIRVRFRELSPALQAAVLRLDPLADREEYAELTALVEDESIRSLADLEHGRLEGAEAARSQPRSRALRHLAGA